MKIRIIKTANHPDRYDHWTTVDNWYMVPKSKFVYHYHGTQNAEDDVGEFTRCKDERRCGRCGKYISEEILSFLEFLSLDKNMVHKQTER